MDISTKLAEISKKFCIQGQFVGYEAIQIGNVNKTYEVRFRLPDGTPKSYLVQNVNTYAFHNPIQLMDNIDKVTEHIRSKKPGQVALHFHHTADRKTYVIDDGNFWRMTNFIPSVTYNTVSDQHIVRNAGKAFGEFQVLLSDFDSSQLCQTIPGFHNTKLRYKQLEEAIRQNPKGRAAEVQNEIDYLMQVRQQACRLTDMLEKGELPLRVTHNDTKINNVLFHPENKSAMVVVDLDTVMPGLIGHDFGDAIRFAANKVQEDCRDADKAGLDLNVFRAFSEGFLEMTAETLTENERKTLALSCFTLTAELATRFLADYILGDPYFNIKYPEHNLVRTRCQIALAKDMQLHMSEMERIVTDCVEAAKK